jgi:hypothetical protein
MNGWIPIAFAVVSSALFWWGAYRYFTGQISEWRKGVDEKQAELVRRLERHIDKDDIAHEKVAIISNDQKRDQKDIQDLRDYKHSTVVPYVGAMDAMNRRVERIEKVLNGKLRQ